MNIRGFNRIALVSVGIAAFVALFALIGYRAVGRFRNTLQLCPPKTLQDLPGKILRTENLNFVQGIGTEYKVLATSSLERIFQDGSSVTEPVFEDRVQLSAARNEFESFQLAVFNGAGELPHVRFDLSELSNPDGHRLGGNAVSWRVIGYVPTKKPYYPVKRVGRWPDPLLPAQPVTIAPHSVQPFWFTIFIAPETTPGIYYGSIEVLVDKALTTTIPIQIEVYPFTLPRRNTLKTAFDFYGHITDKRYPIRPAEDTSAYRARIERINDAFIVSMLQCRMNPILNLDIRSEQEQARLRRYISYGLTQFAVGKHGGTFNNNWPESDREINALIEEYQTYGEILAAQQWTDKHYIYAWDESALGAPRIAKIAAMIHRASPQLRTMVCYHGFWDPAKFPHWGDDIDIWTFGISDYDREKFDLMVGMGKEMWLYVSGSSSDGAPNLAIDADSMEYRIIPWMCWKFDIKGFLYWCVNWWPRVDPFESAANTAWNQNGNGLLFYPGKDEPINSLRAEIFRDGMEDYEYLVLLRDLLKKFEQRGLQNKYAREYFRAKEFLAVNNEIVASFTDFARAPGKLLVHRKKLAEAIIQIMAINSIA